MTKVETKRYSFVNRLVWPADKGEASRLLQTQWDKKWSSPSQARWADRPAPVEVIEAVQSGWLPNKGRMLDLGCGTAEIAAWFAERGYQATGVDMAQAAIDRAAARHGHLSNPIEFIAIDLCAQTLPNRAFEILIDRGCLHQLPENLVADYVRNISSVAAPGARMMLFTKAFRDGRSFGDAEETSMRTEWARRTFADHFDLERALPTYLNPDNPKDPLPGMAFWLSRAP
jgi:SAM-dependent methyltransferase